MPDHRLDERAEFIVPADPGAIMLPETEFNEALAGTDDGHACADRSFANYECSLALHDGGVPDAHTLDVGDRVVWAGR